MVLGTVIARYLFLKSASMTFPVFQSIYRFSKASTITWSGLSVPISLLLVKYLQDLVWLCAVSVEADYLYPVNSSTDCMPSLYHSYFQYPECICGRNNSHSSHIPVAFHFSTELLVCACFYLTNFLRNTFPSVTVTTAEISARSVIHSSQLILRSHAAHLEKSGRNLMQNMGASNNC